MKPCIAFLIALICLAACNTPARAQFSNSPCNQGRAEDVGLEDPRNPRAVCFPEVGRMYIDAVDQEFMPNNLFALGDINHDGIDDWGAISKYSNNGKYGYHLYIYRGKQGKLPDSSDRQYVGPTELEAQTTLLAYGDWDGDGKIDLCCRIQIKGDTSFGNVKGYDIAQCVIFWGQDSGRYSINDTTRLSNSMGAWGGPQSGCSFDANGDGVCDLILRDAGQAVSDGKIAYCARLFIYKGSSHQRWGQNGVVRTADLLWWSSLGGGNLYPMDQDGDGNLDIGFIASSDQGTGGVGVLYGRRNMMPDTNSMETVNLLLANGHYAMFTDVTGDKVPELIINSGSQERLKIYIGIRGQRLKEQFGTGIDPAPLDSQRWWGRPWAKLRQAAAINTDWGNSFSPLWNLGDGNFDGISDIYTISDPYLICYSGGRFLDEYIDGLVDLRPLGTLYVSVARLGNILGDGKPVIAIRGGGRTIMFVQASSQIPNDGYSSLRFPTGTLVGVNEQPSVAGNLLQLQAIPNPGNGQLVFRWNNPELKPAHIRITDLNGKQVFSATVPAATYTWQAAAYPRGVYYLEVSVENHRQTLQLHLP